MAPELYQSESYNEKVDIYAFGMCLCQLLSGEIPYNEYKSIPDIMNAVIQGKRPEILDHLSKKVILSNDELKQVQCILLKVLNKDPHMRPSACELLKYSFFSASGTSLTAPPQTILQGGRMRRIKRSPSMRLTLPLKIVKDADDDEIQKMLEDLKNEDGNYRSDRLSSPTLLKSPLGITSSLTSFKTYSAPLNQVKKEISQEHHQSFVFGNSSPQLTKIFSSYRPTSYSLSSESLLNNVENKNLLNDLSPQSPEIKESIIAPEPKEVKEVKELPIPLQFSGIPEHVEMTRQPSDKAILFEYQLELEGCVLSNRFFLKLLGCDCSSGKVKIKVSDRKKDEIIEGKISEICIYLCKKRIIPEKGIENCYSILLDYYATNLKLKGLSLYD